MGRCSNSMSQVAEGNRGGYDDSSVANPGTQPNRERKSMSNSQPDVKKPSSNGWRQLYQSEDWWAIWIGVALLLICLVAVLVAGANGDGAYASPLKGWLTKPGSWSANPMAALVCFRQDQHPAGAGRRLSAVADRIRSWRRRDGSQVPRLRRRILDRVRLGNARLCVGRPGCRQVLQSRIRAVALALGLLISNTIGTPDWVRPAVGRSSLSRPGLVLLGAEVLFSRLLTLGLPGIFVAWVVTPIVLVTHIGSGRKY